MTIKLRSGGVTHAIFWGALGACWTFFIVFLITGSLRLSAAWSAADFVLKAALLGLWGRSCRQAATPARIPPAVVWLTGLSGSGKSTIADALMRSLQGVQIKAERLDGDTIRNLFPDTGFTKEERDRHIKRVGHLASVLEKNGILVIAAFVSPYRSSREFVKSICKNYVEIHVSTSLEECERRDVKGLYKKARSGQIQNFTGVTDPYEAPQNPDLRIDSEKITVEEAVALILKKLEVLPR